MLEVAGVTVPVTDMPKARTFYAQLLDREPVVEDPAYSLFEVDGVQLGLLAVSGQDTAGGAQPLLRTPDLEGERERIRQLAEDVGAIQEQYGHRLFLFTDPDGNTLEVYQSPLDG